MRDDSSSESEESSAVARARSMYERATESIDVQNRRAAEQQRQRQLRYRRRRGAAVLPGSDESGGSGSESGGGGPDDSTGLNDSGFVGGDSEEDSDYEAGGRGSHRIRGRSRRVGGRSSRRTHAQATRTSGRARRPPSRLLEAGVNGDGAASHESRRDGRARRAARRAARRFIELSGSERDEDENEDQHDGRDDEDDSDMRFGGSDEDDDDDDGGHGAGFASPEERAAARKQREALALVRTHFDPPSLPRSDWLRRTRPSPGAYVPQLGDEVVLVRPAFEAYVQAQIDARGGDDAIEIPTAAWGRSAQLVACRVVSVQFAFPAADLGRTNSPQRRRPGRGAAQRGHTWFRERTKAGRMRLDVLAIIELRPDQVLDASGSGRVSWKTPRRASMPSPIKVQLTRNRGDEFLVLRSRFDACMQLLGGQMKRGARCRVGYLEGGDYAEHRVYGPALDGRHYSAFPSIGAGIGLEDAQEAPWQLADQVMVPSAPFSMDSCLSSLLPAWRSLAWNADTGAVIDFDASPGYGDPARVLQFGIDDTGDAVASNAAASSGAASSASSSGSSSSASSDPPRSSNGTLAGDQQPADFLDAVRPLDPPPLGEDRPIAKLYPGVILD